MSDNYTIVETFTLPSGGKLYGDNFNPEIKLRSMTTNEEMKRLAPSERKYKNMCDIIDDCMVDKCEISSYDMCLADYQFLLHRLRIVTYGDDYKMQTTCPLCGSVSNRTIKLSELEIKPYTDDCLKYLEFDLSVTKKHVQLAIQTPRSIDDIEVKSNEIKKKVKDINYNPNYILTLMSLIGQVDGKNLDAIRKEDWVKSLPMGDTNTIIQHASRFTESFGIQPEIVTECKMCGLDYRNPFRINNEFFGPSIDI